MIDVLRVESRGGLRLVTAMVLMASGLTPLYGQRSHNQSAAAGNRMISGVVVSATTGRPLENADVTLRESEANTASQETNTDTEGRFSFSGLGDGQFSIRASHRGYIAAALDEHEGYSTAVVTGPGLTTTGLRFALSPQGVIYGVVTDDAGDPVPHGQVSLYRKDTRMGVERIQRSGSATTDDLGHYEISRLPTGNYYVAVVAKPWYATHASPRFGRDGSEVDPPRSVLDVAYPTTYYPEATDAASAAVIAVKAGDRVAINVALHAVQAVQVKLPTQSGQGGGGFGAGELRQEVFGTEERVQASPMVFERGEEGNRSSTMIIAGVAPGEYTLGSPGRGGQAGYTVDASGDTAVVRPLDGAGASAEISGIVAMADGSSLPSSLSLSLRKLKGDTEQMESQVVANVDAKGNFEFHDVAPGEYRLRPAASGMAVGAISMTASGATVKGTQVQVGSAPVMLAAMLVTSRAGLRGYVKTGERAEPGAMVVLVPVDATGKPLATRPDLFRRDQSNTDGSFLFNQVLPGRYVVVAIQDGWGLEWARPEVIEPYLNAGVKVEMSLKSSDLQLKDAVALQLK